MARRVTVAWNRSQAACGCTEWVSAVLAAAEAPGGSKPNDGKQCGQQRGPLKVNQSASSLVTVFSHPFGTVQCWIRPILDPANHGPVLVTLPPAIWALPRPFAWAENPKCEGGCTDQQRECCRDVEHAPSHGQPLYHLIVDVGDLSKVSSDERPRRDRPVPPRFRRRRHS